MDLFLETHFLWNTFFTVIKKVCKCSAPLELNFSCNFRFNSRRGVGLLVSCLQLGTKIQRKGMYEFINRKWDFVGVLHEQLWHVYKTNSSFLVMRYQAETEIGYSLIHSQIVHGDILHSRTIYEKTANFLFILWLEATFKRSLFT